MKNKASSSSPPFGKTNAKKRIKIIKNIVKNIVSNHFKIYVVFSEYNITKANKLKIKHTNNIIKTIYPK
jgi:hypothetical protein